MKTDRKHRGLFAPSLSTHLALIAIALAAGGVTYVSTVSSAYRDLARSYLDVTCFEGLFGARSHLPATIGPRGAANDGLMLPAEQEANLRVLFRALQLMGLKRETDTAAALLESTEEFKPVVDALVVAPPTKETILTDLPVLEAIAHVASWGGAAPGTDADVYRRDTATVLAAQLARQPGAVERVTDQLGAGSAGAFFHDTARVLGPNLPWSAGWAFFGIGGANDAGVLRNLYRQVGAYDRANAFWDLRLPDDNPALKRFVATDRFFHGLLGQVHDDPAVRAARMKIALYQGPEQLALWVCLFWMLGLMSYRELRRRRVRIENGAIGTAIQGALNRSPADATDEERSGRALERAAEVVRKTQPRGGRMARMGDRVFGRDAIPELIELCQRELERLKAAVQADVLIEHMRGLKAADTRSRWLLAWLAGAVPAIGFVGTVRGISGALSRADTIVRAMPEQQPAAISDVAGVLGVAFTTTLIALLIGLLTSLLARYQQAKEGAAMERLESTLKPLLAHALLPRVRP